MMNHNPANLDAPQSLRQLIEQREDLSAADRLRIVRHLALLVQALHQSGRTHRAIDAEAVLIDDRLRAELASPPSQRRFGALDADPEFCPPDLAGTEALRLPEKIEAAAAVLKKNRRTLTPQQIDFYQLGVLLCRLLSGESIARYMYSSKVKARVPQFARSVLQRALGYKAADRFDDCGQLIAALDEAIERAGSPPVSSPMTETPLAGQIRATGDDTQTYSDAPASRVADDTPLPFERLGHFRLLRRIGRGGMGDVYLADDETLDRQVAIKVLPADLARDDDFVHRFQAEATAAAGLSHPSVVPVYFIGQDAGHHFFAMQYVEGQSLAERIADGRPLPLDQVQNILEQCLAGLDAAHSQGLIHRDIKPSNILLDSQNDRAVLVDFGLVRRLGPGEGITTAGTVLGTVDYIAPEQATGRTIDGRADLYALGVLAYQLLSGRLPFLADTPMAMIFQHAYEEPTPLGEIAPDVPQPIQNIVARMMAKHPDNRYASCAEALSDLTSYREGRPISAPTPNFQSDLRRTVDHLSAAMADHQRHRDQLTRLLDTTRTMAADLSAKITEQEQFTLAIKPSTTPEEAEAMHAQQKEQEETTAKLKSQQEEQLRQIEDVERELNEVDATLERLHGQWDGLKERMQVGSPKKSKPGRLPPVARRRLVGLVLIGCVVVAASAFLYLLRDGRMFDSGETPDKISLELAPGEELPVGQWVDVLGMVDVEGDKFLGTWSRQGNAVTGSGGHVTLPVLLEGSYEFEVTFTRNTGGDLLCFTIPVGSRVCQLNLAAHGNQFSGLDLIGGKLLVENESKRPGALVNGRRYTIRYEVRLEGQSVHITTLLDGKLYVQWVGHETWLSAPGAWLDARRPGLGSAQEATFHSARLRVISGKAKRIEPGDPKVSASLAQAFPGRSLQGHNKPISALAFNAERQTLVSASEDGTLKLWRMPKFNPAWASETGGLLRTLVGQVGPLSVAFGPENRHIIVGTRSGVIERWDLTEETLSRSMTSPISGVRCVAFSPGAAIVALGTTEPSLRTIDLTSGGASHDIKGIEVTVNSIAFSPDTSLLVSGHEDGSINLWRTDSEDPHRSLQGHDQPVKSLAFSPDGSMLTSAGDDGTVRLWDVASGEVRHLLEGHEGAVNTVAFNPDGTIVASGGEDNIIRIWNTATGRLRRKLVGHTGAVTALAFGPDGGYLASGGRDQIVNTWDMVRVLDPNWVEDAEPEESE